jgi:hypothetical protein
VGAAKTTEWTELFDTVITGSCKPGFFESDRNTIFEVWRCSLTSVDPGLTALGISA